MIDDKRLRAIAQQQHGLVSYEQVRDAGLSAKQRLALLDGRRWERLTDRVVRLVGTPATPLQELSRRVLAAGPGGALAGDTSLFHWGGRGAVRDPIRVSRPRDRARRGCSGEPTLLPPEHLLVLDGIRSVTPSRAIFDIAGSVQGGAEKQWHLDRMERLVNNAGKDGLVSEQSLLSMLDDMAQRGRPGIKVMRLILDVVDFEELTDSGNETRVVQICRRYGLPALRRQVNVGDHEGWIGRVDFAYDDVPFVLEVQGDRFHTSQIDKQSDSTRILRLEDAGFVVETVTDTQVWHHAEIVAGIIRAGRARAARRVGLSSPSAG